MADISLTTSATLSGSPTVTVFVYEDTDNDGVYENVAQQDISTGTNSYTLSGFDDTSGNDWYVAVRRETAVTDTVELQSITLEPAGEVFDLKADGVGDGVGSATTTVNRYISGDGTGDGVGAGTIIRTRGIFADGAADGIGTATIIRTRSLFADGAASGVGTALMSRLVGLSGDGTASGLGTAVLNGLKTLTFGVQSSIKNALQFGTR